MGNMSRLALIVALVGTLTSCTESNSEDAPSSGQTVTETGYLACSDSEPLCGGDPGCHDSTGAALCGTRPDECDATADCGCWGLVQCLGGECVEPADDDGFVCPGLLVSDFEGTSDTDDTESSEPDAVDEDSAAEGDPAEGADATEGESPDADSDPDGVEPDADAPEDTELSDTGETGDTDSPDVEASECSEDADCTSEDPCATVACADGECLATPCTDCDPATCGAALCEAAPDGALCALTGLAGETVSCSIHVARERFEDPRFTALEMDVNYDDAMLEFQGFAETICEPSAPEACSVVSVAGSDNLSSGYQLLAGPADPSEWAGAGSFIVFKLGPVVLAPISSAWLEDGVVIGQDYVAELQFVLETDAPADSPLFVFGAKPVAGTWDATGMPAQISGCRMTVTYPSCAGDSEVCDDQDPCTADTCDAESGACTWTPLEECALDVSPCCLGGGPAACEHDYCKTVVCDVDPYCCETQWDYDCLHSAKQRCEALCGATDVDCAGDEDACDDGDECTTDSCSPETGKCAWVLDAGCEPSTNCCVVHSEVGCDNETCEGLVCSSDAWCCEMGWDEACAETALEVCSEVCP